MRDPPGDRMDREHVGGVPEIRQVEGGTCRENLDHLMEQISRRTCLLHGGKSPECVWGCGSPVTGKPAKQAPV